jgi:hypothetical protein
MIYVFFRDVRLYQLVNASLASYFLLTPHMKMKEYIETSAYKILTQGKLPKVRIQHSEVLKSGMKNIWDGR